MSLYAEKYDEEFEVGVRVSLPAPCRALGAFQALRLTRRPPSALSGQFRGNHMAPSDNHAAGCPLRRRT